MTGGPGRILNSAPCYVKVTNRVVDYRHRELFGKGLRQPRELLLHHGNLWPGAQDACAVQGTARLYRKSSQKL